MKKALFTLSGVILLFTYSNAQYAAMIEDGRQWNTHTIAALGKFDIAYTLDGDTTINGKTYAKLYSGGIYNTGHVLNSLLYEDTASQTVEIVPVVSSVIHPGFTIDFNLSKGDSIYTPCIGYSWYLKVDSVYQMDVVPGVSRKALLLKLHDSANTYTGGDAALWIEGVGPYNGPNFPYPIACVTDVPHPQLLCVKDDQGGLLYDNPSFASCSVLSIDESKNVPELELYPNPVGSILYLDNISGKHLYQVFDNAGKEVLKGELNSNVIDVQLLEKGLYILFFEDLGSFKFLKN